MNLWSVLERAFGWGGVVAYHGVGESPRTSTMHVTPRQLRAHLLHLRDRHRIVPLRELVQRWHSQGSTQNCVAITFDDAYAGVLVHALPILRELDVPATVFVASDHAELGAAYWWDEVARDNKDHTDRGREAIALLGLGELKDVADDPDEIRNRVLARFAGRWPGGIAVSQESIWRSMTFSELETLADDGRIDFGVHTLSHAALPLLPYDEQVREMRNNFVLLQERLPRVLPVVAYPYGLYDARTIRAAREAGMIAGVTMEGRATANHPDPMTVPRIGAGEIHPPASLTLRLNRALRPALVIRNRGVHPRVPFVRARRRAAEGVEA